jgi:hypothetical protein
MKTSLSLSLRMSLTTLGLIICATLYCTLLLSQSSVEYLSSNGQYLESLSFTSNEVSPSKSYWKTGALIGFGVGVTGSAMAVYQGGSTSLCDQSKNQDATSTVACVSIIGGSGLVVGGLGALIGSFIKKSVSEDVGDRIGFQITEQTAYGHTVSIQWNF